jgi:hypothetical protein
MIGEADNKMLELLLQRIMNGIESVALLPASEAMGDGTILKD